MARRGFSGMTALRAALGAATGVGEGLQQREVLAAQRLKEKEELRRYEESAILQRLNAGLTPIDDILPSEQGRVGPLATKPLARPVAAASMSPSTLGQFIAQRTQPLAGAPSLEAPTTFAPSPVVERPKSAVQRVMDNYDTRTPRTVRIGEQRYALQPTAQELSERNAALQKATLEDAKAAESTAKAKEIEDTADLLQASYVGSDGKPMSRQQAVYSAKMGKDPIDLGLIERPMSEADRARIAIARANLGIARSRLRMDQQAKQDAVSEVQNFYDEERKTIAEFMPTPYTDKNGKKQYNAPKIVPKAASLMLTRSDWTNWMASEDAQRYSSAVKRISDSYAVAKEGRGASNSDKEAYLNAVAVRPGEFGNYRLMDEKWKRLQSYISFLESKDKKGAASRQGNTSSGSALDDLESMGM